MGEIGTQLLAEKDTDQGHTLSIGVCPSQWDHSSIVVGLHWFHLHAIASCPLRAVGGLIGAPHQVGERFLDLKQSNPGAHGKRRKDVVIVTGCPDPQGLGYGPAAGQRGGMQQNRKFFPTGPGDQG